jgi:cytochrome b561
VRGDKIKVKAQNTVTTYGWVAILLHWLVAITIFAMAGLGFYMVDLDYYNAWYHKAPYIHKSVGVLLLLVMLLRVFWRFGNVIPKAVEGVKAWEEKIASLVHKAMYLLVFAIMGSGYLISTADAKSIDVFGWFELPATLTSIPNQEDVAGVVHLVLVVILLVLVVMHAGAALKHHFIDKNRTLLRMLGR